MRNVMRGGLLACACVALSCVRTLEGQAKQRVNVTVRSAVDSMLVAGAIVWLADVDATGRVELPALTRIQLPRGSGAVTADVGARFALIGGALGYARDTVVMDPDVRERLVTIWLDRHPFVLPPISVVSQRRSRAPPHGAGIRRTRDELQISPAGMGVDDPVRALSIEPGIRLTEPFSSRLSVRGSGPSANLFYLEGLPLYNPLHVGGFFTALPTAAVERLDVWTGTPPAALEGSGGGTLDFGFVPSRPGVHGNASASIMSVDASTSLSSPELGYAVAAARRSWLDGSWATAGSIEDFGFSDLLVTGGVELGPDSRLQVLGFTSGDLMRNRRLDVLQDSGVDTFRYARSSSLLGLRGETVFGDATFGIRSWYSAAEAGGTYLLVAGLGRANAHNELSDLGTSFTLRSEVRDFRWLVGITLARRHVASDVDYYALRFTETGQAHLPLGGLRHESSHVLVRPFGGVTITRTPMGALEVDGSLTAAAGDVLPGGRIRWSREPSPGLSLAVEAGSSIQTLQLLSDSRQELWGEFSAVDHWIGSTSDASGPAPVRNDQVVASVRGVLGPTLELSMETYVKRSTGRGRLEAHLDNGATAGLAFVEDRSIGLAATARLRPHPDWLLSASYTLARSITVDSSQRYMSDYDVPHRLQLLAARQRPSGFVASISATIESGYPYDPYVSAYEATDFDPFRGPYTSPYNPPALVFIRGSPNSARLDPSHRVDLQIGYRHDGDAIDWELFIAVINLSNGQSFPIEPDGHAFDFESRRRLVRFKDVTTLPPLPIAGARIRF